MNCPRCATALASHTILEVEVDRCSRCAGLWLDRGEVERASRPTGRFVAAAGGASMDASVRLPDDPTKLTKCPRCGRSCFRERYSSTEVELDRCGRGCGVWLDQGELEKIAEHRRRTSMTSPRAARAPSGPSSRSATSRARTSTWRSRSYSFGRSLLPTIVRLRPICTLTGLPPTSMTVLPFTNQPSEPVENSLTSASRF